MVQAAEAWRWFEPARDRHEEKVARVVRQLRDHPGGPVSLKKRAVSHVVPKARDKRHRDRKIDVSDLREILAIDPVGLTCTAEPGVTFDELVKATLPLGLLPIIVPELRTITIGGAVSGCSVESMSFRHGGFHDTCLEYEVITARGQVLRCAPDEHPLLFQMMHGSFGTLGILSRLTFKLIRAKPFVRLNHLRHARFDDYRDAIWRQFVAPEVDYLDGIIHSPREWTLSLGEFVDRAPYTNRYDWMKVYYRSTATRSEDYLATADYLFRYDNGVTNVHPKSAIGRLLLGKFVHSDQLLRLADKLHRFLPAERPDVIVDLFLPLSRFGDFMSWHERAIGFFPLWCVPYRLPRRYEWIAGDFLDGVDDELFVDLAIYGLRQRDGRNFYRELEDKLVELQGIKTLISYNYYDEDTFWRIWNKPNYQAAKRLTDPDDYFRDLYTKTCRAARGL